MRRALDIACTTLLLASGALLGSGVSQYVLGHTKLAVLMLAVSSVCASLRGFVVEGIWIRNARNTLAKLDRILGESGRA